MYNFEIVYHQINDWYVGDIYNYIANRFVEKYKNFSFEIRQMREVQGSYGQTDYVNDFPSIYNIYNMLITNKRNKKTFVNGLGDHSIACFYNEADQNKVDIKSGGIVSDAFFKEEHEDIIKKFNINPSFYILEKFSDLEYIEELYNSNIIKENKCYFNGLIHTNRNRYFDILKHQDIFVLENKSIHWRMKKDYLDKLSKYSMSLGMDGACHGGICHRDIEAMGIGNLLIREQLGSLTFNPLIPNTHYISLFSEEEKYNLNHTWDEDGYNYYGNIINSRMAELLKNNELISHVREQGRNWYVSNCLPEKQFEIVEMLTQNLELLI